MSTKGNKGDPKSSNKNPKNLGIRPIFDIVILIICVTDNVDLKTKIKGYFHDLKIE